MFVENNLDEGIMAISSNDCSSELKTIFPDILITRTTDPLQLVRLVYNHLLQIMEKACPVHIVLRMTLGPLTLGSCALGVMFGTGDVLFLGHPTLEILDLDIYARLTSCVRRKAGLIVKPMEAVNCIACRRVSLSVSPMQQKPMDD